MEGLLLDLATTECRCKQTASTSRGRSNKQETKSSTRATTTATQCSPRAFQAIAINTSISGSSGTLRHHRLMVCTSATATRAEAGQESTVKDRRLDTSGLIRQATCSVAMVLLTFTQAMSGTTSYRRQTTRQQSTRPGTHGFAYLTQTVLHSTAVRARSSSM